MRYLFIFILFLPGLSYAQKTKLIRKHHQGSKVLKEAYFVLKKNKQVKHGSYKSYYKSGTLKEEGAFEKNRKIGIWKWYDKEGTMKRVRTYENGRQLSEKKVGIWLKYHEGGQVITGFDYDKNEKVATVIKVNVSYPRTALEANIQGEVQIRLRMNKDCHILALSVVKSLHPDCDKEALKGLKLFSTLIAKYDPERCANYDEVIPIQFNFN